MSPVIRAARIDREPVVLVARPRSIPSTLALESSAAAPDVAAESALPAPVPPVVSDAARLAEQERLQRESISAERQRVLERAREQGYQAGVEQGRAEYETQLEAVRQLLGSMHAALTDGINGTEDLIVEIAFEAVGKILGEALARRDGVQAAVREVIRGVREREHLVVRVSPRDHQLLTSAGMLPRNGDGNRLGAGCRRARRTRRLPDRNQRRHARRPARDPVAAPARHAGERGAHAGAGGRVMTSALHRYVTAVRNAEFTRRSGTVSQFFGLVVESVGPDAFLGEVCEIYSRSTATPIASEVVGLKDGKVLLMPYGELRGIGLGCEVLATGRAVEMAIGEGLLGRVIDAFGRPLDGRPLPPLPAQYRLTHEPLNPLARSRIRRVLETGVKSIDGLLTIGRGQRVGVFSGSGVGKSTLLGMIARNMKADINVIALIGERGREVLEFIEQNLGPAGLKRSVVVVATSDQPALVRARAAYAATAIAEYFRDRRKDVLLDHGFDHALRDGTARDRTVGGRAANGAGLHAVGFRRAAEAARTLRHDRPRRLDHGDLFGAGRRR